MTAMSFDMFIVGNQYTGKSNIIERFIYWDSFKLSNHMSWNEIYVLKLNFDNQQRQMKFVDYTGLSAHWRDLSPLRLVFNAVGCILVFDLTDQDSFDAVPMWLNKRIRVICPHIKVVLVGAKCDLASKRVVALHQAEELASELGIIYIETSAETGHNISNVFKILFEECFENANIQIRHILGERTCIQIDTPNHQIEQNAILQLQDNKLSSLNKESSIKLLQQRLDKAKKQHRTVPVRFLKVLLTGSGAAGKTSFSHLLLKRKFITEHHSTNVVHANHAVSVSKAVIQSSSVNEQVTWIELGFDLQISHLQSVLRSSSKSPVSIKNVTKSDLRSPQWNTEKIQPSYTSITQSITRTDIVKQWFTKFLVGDSVKREHLLTFDNILDSSLDENTNSSSDTLVYQPDEVLNVITLLDTGGQPEYIHLLPTINIYHTVNFIVHDLSKKLDDQVLVKYSQHGKQIITPYHLNYSNIDMIKLLMSAANDAAERPSSHIPQLVSIPGSDKNSYLCLVGTHVDQVTSDIVDDTASKLTSMVDDMKCQAMVWQNTNGNVLFPVDNTTAGRINEDPVADIIRNKIEQLTSTKDIYNVPVTWMLLELEIQKFCTKENRSNMSFQECVVLANSSALFSDAEEVKNVLRYYHLLGILLYYEEVPGLCDYVITDHQWFFDKLSSVVCLTFQDGSSNRRAVQKLKYQGLLTKELFQHVNWTDNIRKEFFLLLLAHMKIIAPVFAEENDNNFCVVDEEEYFIPFILPTYPSKQKNNHLFNYGHMQGEPLLIRFQSGLLPRGLLCCLVVELLQNPPNGWHPHFSKGDTHHTFRNLITFSLPNAYSLSLFDGISHLEVQIRHPQEKFSSIHFEVYKSLVHALTEVCQHLNFDHNRLQYGFLCQSCSDSPDDHIAIVPVVTPSLCYAECSINSTQHVQLSSSHLMWLLPSGQVLTISDSVKDQYSPNSTQTDDCEHLPELTSLSLSDGDQPAMKRPVMRVLHDIILPRVAAHWSVLADYLEYELEYKQLIQKKCNNDPLECCVMLLEDWLSSKRGVSPKSWRVLIKVLREIKVLTSAAEKIEEDLINAGVKIS
ncbi:uncharacterized protein [Dysidea avara]|uniref:uncharacterized protein isoform X2 n=1 Tax=Dysidea avara TaxID=196820 RepID=UPI00332371A0